MIANLLTNSETQWAADYIQRTGKFPLKNRQFIITTPIGKQKGYNVGQGTVLEAAGGLVTMIGALRYLNKGAPVVQMNWRWLVSPHRFYVADLKKWFATRKPFEFRTFDDEKFHARLELDEKSEALFVVWLDQQES